MGRLDMSTVLTLLVILPSIDGLPVVRPENWSAFVFRSHAALLS